MDDLSVPQIVNLAYTALSMGRNRVQMAELEQMLAPPEDREKVVERANVESMKQLGGYGMGPPPPAKPKGGAEQ